MVKKLILVFGFIVALILASVVGWTMLAENKAYTPSDGGNMYVKLDKGMNFKGLTAKLAKDGLVKNEKIFLFRARIHGWDTSIKAGLYEVKPGENADDLMEKMVRGETAPSIAVTIPEGYTVKQIARKLSENGIIDAAAFLNAAKKYHSDAIPAPSAQCIYPVEGYLFPDTYYFMHNSTPEDIIKKMTEQFNKVADAKYQQEIKAKGLSLSQAVIIASLVEREAKAASERPIIAGVFMKRLSIGMPLQSCATVQYLLPKQKEKLYYKDLKIDSPYNTYKYPGLPPGPIANPGKPSLMAVANAQENSGYLYFVAKNNGTHTFSKTLAEHNAAKKMNRE